MGKPVELIIGCQGLANENEEKFSQDLENVVVNVINHYNSDAELVHVSDILEDECCGSKISSHMFSVEVEISGSYSAERKSIINSLINAGKSLGTYTSWLVHINGKEGK